MAETTDLLPDYDHVLFRNTPLVLCLVQVKYPPQADFKEAESKIARDLQRALRQTYPHFRRDHTTNLVVTPSGVHQQEGPLVLRFESLHHDWAVLVSEDAVSLEARSYSDIQELASRFHAVLECIDKVLAPGYQTRFGLRYINEIRHPDGDSYQIWQRLLNEELLASSFHVPLGGTIEQTVNEVHVARPDGKLLVRHGFLHGTTVVPREGTVPRTDAFYLLDMDYSDPTSRDFEADPRERLLSYNEALYRIFRWAIGDGELYEYLGAER